MPSFAVSVELGDSSFDEAGRYFLTPKLVDASSEAIVLPRPERTDVAPTPTTEPVFRTRSFAFALPSAEPDRWSLQLTAINVAADETADESVASAAAAKGKARVVGVGTLALGGLLVIDGSVERRMTLLQPDDGPAPGQAAGNINVTLAAGDAAAPPAPPPVPNNVGAPSRAKTPKANFRASDALEREVAFQQSQVERLTDDLQKKIAEAQKSDEEVMLMRGINKKLEGEIGKLRGSFDERERAMEQLASDATNVENIDLPQLQSRHRMLGAAYRADRRQMESLKQELAQRTAALGTQEQLAKSYARLKEAHTSQGQQLQRLQEEARKVDKYRATAKQQEAIIQRLEALLAAALKDAKRVKTVEPQLEQLKKDYAGLEKALKEEKADKERIEKESKAKQRELEQAMASGMLEAPEPVIVETAGKPKPEGEEADPDMPLPARGGGGVAHEEHVKLLMRAEKAERRAAALEDEMQEMARQNGRDVAKLKMKLAEAEAVGMGGFGSAANLALGEITPPGMGLPAPPDVSDGGLPKAPPPLGSSRRATPPNKRLDPLGPSPPPPVGSAS